MTYNLNENSKHSLRYEFLFALSALGVVYGDIGTSPLYAFKESLHHGHNILINSHFVKISSVCFTVEKMGFWPLLLLYHH